MNIYILIPARIGSKSIQKKVLRPLCNKPLIIYFIEQVLNIKNAQIYINTDSKEISSAVLRNNFGTKINIFKRKKELGEDEVTLDEIAYNFVTELKLQTGLLVTLQPTSPLININKINNSLIKIQTEELDTIVSVVENKKLEWDKMPEMYFTPKYQSRKNRQYIDPVYTETGAYVINKIETLINKKSRFGDKVFCDVNDDIESIDIDYYYDWIIAEAIISGRNILYVTSANEKLGSGHIQRCLSLAHNFPSYNNEFILINTEECWIQLVDECNYNIKILSNVEELYELELLKTYNIIVLDILNTSTKLISNIRKINNSVKIVSFEDLGEGSINTDLTINELYPSINQNKNILSGPNYCFFRSEFLNRETINYHDRDYDIVISFGGTDPNSLTCRILNILNDIDRILKIKVILGLGAKRLLDDVIGISNNSHHTVDYEDGSYFISDIFINSKLGITGGGRTAYEFNVCKVDTIVICQNTQELTHLYATETNNIMNLGLHSQISDQNIYEIFYKLLSDIERKWPFNNEINLNPNKSNHRIIKHIKNLL